MIWVLIFLVIAVLVKFFTNYGVNTDKISVNGLSRIAISALIIATIWFGIYPQPILDALKK